MLLQGRTALFFLVIQIVEKTINIFDLTFEATQRGGTKILTLVLGVGLVIFCPSLLLTHLDAFSYSCSKV